MFLPLAMIAGGLLLAYVGLANPPGGLTGALGSILHGASPGKVANNPEGFTPSASGSGQLGKPYGAVTGAGRAGTVRAAVVAEARRWLGTPYQWGGDGPPAGDRGFDCSGLTQYVYRVAAGISLPRTTGLQQLVGRAVTPWTDAEPGDLVFFGAPAYHVGIYIGGGQMIAAPHTGTVVKVETIVPSAFTGPTTARDVIGGGQ